MTVKAISAFVTAALVGLASASCAQGGGSGGGSGSSTGGSASSGSSAGTATPSQCVGLMGAQRDQCMRDYRTGSSTSGTTKQ
jgi:hypothetical protein